MALGRMQAYRRGSINHPGLPSGPGGMNGPDLMGGSGPGGVSVGGGVGLGPNGLQLSGSEPPPDTTGGFETVSNKNLDWTTPGRLSGLRPNVGGYSFGPFSGYPSGVWNPLMQPGDLNMYGGLYRGIEFGPNQGGGSGYHTVFTPGNRGGRFNMGGIAGLRGLRGSATTAGTGKISFNRTLPNGTVISTGGSGGGFGAGPPNLQGQRNV